MTAQAETSDLWFTAPQGKESAQAYYEYLSDAMLTELQDAAASDAEVVFDKHPELSKKENFADAFSKAKASLVSTI